MKPGDHPDFFRFPAPEGRSRESSIRLDRQGRFWHNGELVEHAKLIRALHQWISRHPGDGRYILTNGYDWTYFTVDDVPFQVCAVVYEQGMPRLRLSNEQEVIPEALTVAEDGSLYAAFHLQKQGYEARFRPFAQTQLAPALEEHHGEIGLVIGKQFLVPTARTN